MHRIAGRALNPGYRQGADAPRAPLQLCQQFESSDVTGATAKDYTHRQPQRQRQIGVFIRRGQGFFLSTRAQDIGIIRQVEFGRSCFDFREYTIMRINCARRRYTARGFTFQLISVITHLVSLAGAAMSGIRMRTIVCVFLAVLFGAATAQARPPFRIGGLTCSTGPRVGLVLGSRQDMRCVFVASATGQQYVYTGTIRRLGVDIGVTRGGTLFWAVFARNSQIGRGTLRGSYVGASANVALGLGLGAKVLIGGSRRTITLQPLSVEGQIGVNLALGVARLTLR
jgi:hypothetical protein